jgi:hypothetical protein
MKVVEEVENGLITACAARTLYRIPGKATIAEWIKKYGINESISRKVYIMTREEEMELLRLRKEIKRLERALDDSQVKSLALESLVELAEERYGMDLKKNFGSKVLEELRKRHMPLTSDTDSK